MHLVEIVRGVGAADPAAIALHRRVLEQLLANTRAGTGTFSEIAWIQSELSNLPPGVREE